MTRPTTATARPTNTQTQIMTRPTTATASPTNTQTQIMTRPTTATASPTNTQTQIMTRPRTATASPTYTQTQIIKCDASATKYTNNNMTVMPVLQDTDNDNDTADNCDCQSCKYRCRDMYFEQQSIPGRAILYCKPAVPLYQSLHNPPQ